MTHHALSELSVSDEDIETVQACPVCSSISSRLIYANLADETYFCAPGEWPMVICQECSSGYLSRRLTPSAIGSAYQNYYTHTDPLVVTHGGRKSPLRRILRYCFDRYLFARYGAESRHWKTISFLGALLFFPIKTAIDRDFRHLPKRKNASMRLLDVGCGNGSFLSKAEQFGWIVEGVDFDSRAVQFANERNINVALGGIEIYENRDNLFDFITVSHVIEHLHDPSGFLSSCYRILKPGGIVWIETPNIESESHRVFGSNWRGLEAPRHLVLLNHNSLHMLLKAAGFLNISQVRCPSPAEGMHRASIAIQDGRTQQDLPPLTFKQRLVYIKSRLLASFSRNKSEFITISAVKSYGKAARDD